MNADNDRFSSYEELVEYLSTQIPTTWYPSLILQMVKISYLKHAFITGGASHLVANFEKHNGWNVK